MTKAERELEMKRHGCECNHNQRAHNGDGACTFGPSRGYHHLARCRCAAYQHAARCQAKD